VERFASFGIKKLIVTMARTLFIPVSKFGVKISLTNLESEMSVQRFEVRNIDADSALIWVSDLGATVPNSGDFLHGIDGVESSNVYEVAYRGFVAENVYACNDETEKEKHFRGDLSCIVFVRKRLKKGTIDPDTFQAR